MGECIFCGIVNKKIPAFIVYEDNFSLGILDIKPRTKGMCLIIPKKHFEEMSENIDYVINSFKAALILSEKIKKALNPKFISFSILPSEIKHFHIRIYPIFDQIPLLEGNPIPINENELKEIAEKIKGAKIVERREEEKEKKEEKEERKRSEEEIEWIRRYWERA